MSKFGEKDLIQFVGVVKSVVKKKVEEEGDLAPITFLLTEIDPDSGQEELTLVPVVALLDGSERQKNLYAQQVRNMAHTLKAKAIIQVHEYIMVEGTAQIVDGAQAYRKLTGSLKGYPGATVSASIQASLLGKEVTTLSIADILPSEDTLTGRTLGEWKSKDVNRAEFMGKFADLIPPTN